MSLELLAIEKRLKDLQEFNAKGLAVTNATEYYKRDVRDLLKVAHTLRATIVALTRKNRALEGKEEVPDAAIIASVDAGITRLLNGNFKKPPQDPPAKGGITLGVK